MTKLTIPQAEELGYVVSYWDSETAAREELEYLGVSYDKHKESAKEKLYSLFDKNIEIVDDDGEEIDYFAIDNKLLNEARSNA